MRLSLGYQTHASVTLCSKLCLLTGWHQKRIDKMYQY